MPAKMKPRRRSESEPKTEEEKALLEKQPGLLEALNRLVDPDSYGDPMHPLRWTIKSLRTLAAELQKEGFIIHKDKVGYCLKRLGFCLQQNQKMKLVGPEAEYRDEQFRHINDTVAAYISQNIPVISIDCKKKENIGNFKNIGADYRPAGNPVEVLDHDFPLKEGKAAPYGVYDINRNEGYVTVGISSNTAIYAANSIRNWWNYMGKETLSQSFKAVYYSRRRREFGNMNFRSSQMIWAFKLRSLIFLRKLRNGTR